MYHARHIGNNRQHCKGKKNRSAPRTIRRVLIFLSLCAAFAFLVPLSESGKASRKGTGAYFNDTESASIQFHVTLNDKDAAEGQNSLTGEPESSSQDNKPESKAPVSSAVSRPGSESSGADQAGSQKADSSSTESKNAESEKSGLESSAVEQTNSAQSGL